ncbi:MAG: hypothetical protein Q8P67_20150 [archaeon]|nr:hypothetical protein [archaeon]
MLLILEGRLTVLEELAAGGETVGGVEGFEVPRGRRAWSFGLSETGDPTGKPVKTEYGLERGDVVSEVITSKEGHPKEKERGREREREREKSIK